ncbi:MAG TPA: DUF4215 domain-containing protein [Kofleriaceae bacterium]|nr:DUF4215 domain-containing protein [Kofleriaceae bacterium]
MRALALVAMSISAAGCNAILGIGDVHTSGGIDAPAGTIDAAGGNCPAPPSGGIIGCANITHVNLDGTTTESRQDLHAFNVAAYIADSSATGFTIVTGTASADGTVVVNNIPDGASYYLRLQNPTDPTYSYPHYFYTSQRTLDLGYIEEGRDDTPTTGETDVTFTTTGLTPWKSAPQSIYGQLGDSLGMASFSTGTTAGWAPATPPADGATNLDAVVDWKTGAGEITFSDLTNQAARVSQLVDTTKGDDLWVFQSRLSALQDGDQGDVWSSIIAAAQVPTATMTNGTPLTVTAALAPVPPLSTMQTLNVNLDSFRAAFHDDGRYFFETLFCYRSASPGAASGLGQGQLWSYNNQQIFGSPSSLNIMQAYGNPFPKTWPQMISCSLGHFRPLKTPGTNKQVSAYSYIYSYAPATDNFSWTPVIHGVTNPKVGGKPALAGGAVAFDGTHPLEMQWDAIPGVSHYQVRIIGSVEGLVAVLDTSGTTISIPADTFTKGNFYVFRIFAIQTPSDYTQGHLLRFTAPMSVARLATGLFRLDDRCGNTTVETGEECDPGTAGDTASCDSDCSAVKCGDGYLNTVAGEICDDTTDSPHCNGPAAGAGKACHPNVCGDGYWNGMGEECDDGNTVNGDGCNAQCKLENCGNNMTDAPFEGCDDGNRLNGDGCNSYCQPEQ